MIHHTFEAFLHFEEQMKTSTSSLGSLIMNVWYASGLYILIDTTETDDKLALMTFIKMFPAFMAMATPFAVSN